MTPTLVLLIIAIYSLVLFYIAFKTGKNESNEAFFVAKKQSPWIVVAYGMIGASLSGVTFMSVPGWVGDTHFKYLMVVVGYLIGYAVIALVLMPLYYRMNLTTIYTYLDQRFGTRAHKTGSFFFILSRTIGASFRIYLVVHVLQTFVFDAWNVPFIVTIILFLALVILYTYRGGIKTIIWTDTLQTTFMLLAVIVSIFLIIKELDISFGQLVHNVWNSELSQMIDYDINSRQYYWKQLISGAFIAIAMTGLDQEMMQKNLSIRTLKDAQKNMFSFSIALFFVNLMFLFLGAALYVLVESKGIALPKSSDDLFPMISIQYLSPLAGIMFIIGLISAAYPSADGALTSLTTAFSIDFLGLDKNDKLTEKEAQKVRHQVHIGFAVILFLVIYIFSLINDRAVIDKLFTVAGYTYGPLLGLFAFGILSKRKVNDLYVPFVAVLSPVICYFISEYSVQLFNGYKIGFELLLLNGLLTYLGLWFLSLRIQKN
jgi:Na+/proline symporter